MNYISYQAQGSYDNEKVITEAKALAKITFGFGTSPIYCYISYIFS